MANSKQSRRNFLKKSSLAAVAFTIIPRHVLGGKGFIPPSDKINIGFIGTGKLANGYFNRFAKLSELHIIAASDINSKKAARGEVRSSAMGTLQAATLLHTPPLRSGDFQTV